MNPNLALLIGVLFILIVCVIEFKQRKNNSFAILLPLIWYASIVSRPIALWLNLGDVSSSSENNLSGNPINVAFYTSLTIIGILVLIYRKINWAQFIKSNTWIILLVVYMGLSILWSDLPEVSLKRFIRSTGALVMVLLILSDSNPIEAISRLLKTCFLVHLTLSIILIKYFRSIGVEWDNWLGTEIWVGTTQGKNILGQLAWTSGIFLFWNITRNWKNKEILVDVILLIMAFHLLRGSGEANSVTSIFVFLFGMSILIFLHFTKKKAEYLGRYLISGFIIIIISYFIFQFITDKLLISSAIEFSGRNLTLTDRTYLWNDLLDIAYKNPILGVGYGSFWIGNPHGLWEKYTWEPGQSHNGYIDVFLELGIVGILFLLCLIFSTYKRILKSFTLNYEHGRFRLVLLSMILLNNVTESSLLKAYHHLWFLFLLCAVNIPEVTNFMIPRNNMSYSKVDKTLSNYSL